MTKKNLDIWEWTGTERLLNRKIRLNGDGSVELRDAVSVLQILVGRRSCGSSVHSAEACAGELDLRGFRNLGGFFFRSTEETSLLRDWQIRVM